MTAAERAVPGEGTPAKPPTIYDVAKAAGVAASTVSRALTRPGRVGAATAAHVRQVAADMGYKANPLGPGLRTGRTSMLALVVSDVTNPFYAEIIRGAQSAASEAGFILVLVNAQESGRIERENLERALPTIEGVILAGTRMSDSAIGVMAKQRPVVVLNRDVPGVPGVVLDNAEGARAAVEHLVSLGHRSLTYVAGPEASWVDGVRWHNLRQAAADLGCRATRTGPRAPTVAGGREAADALRGTPPTAIVAYNDQLAIGLMLALQNRGVRVPEDTSIVGFDNVYPAQIVTPGLTTVAAPLRAQGRAAANALLAARENPEAVAGKPRTLPVKLVVRGSTGPVRRTGDR
ncbi:LacI family DNA-binding transcriptional regulator [Yinghuangia sp. YIM S10712]|uniref:LacI family DNA-binding transcriptional regulator n=1 Tax=Yinghuangia sp. YIM S10712 TaxID=3436930 RepID=UPI003F536A00